MRMQVSPAVRGFVRGYPRLRLGALALLPVLALGCGESEPQVAVERYAAIVPNPDPSTFAVFASNSVRLNDRAAVSGGNVGTRQATSGPHLQTGFEAWLGGNTRVDVAFGVYADTLRLGSGTIVGNVYTNALTQSGATFGTVTPFQTLAAMPAVPAITPGSTPITVASGVTQTVSAGNFGVVTVNGRLRLNAGTYRFQSLTVGNNAVIEVRGALQVHVLGRAYFADRGRIELGSGLGLSARNAVFVVAGTNAGSGPLGEPSAFHGNNDVVLRGLVYAPNGTYRLGQRSTHAGAAFSRDALLDADARVTFENGFSCAGNCDDGNPCTVDTCELALCKHTTRPNGSSCADATLCNGQEVCQSGSCTPGTPPVVNDGNPCTVDACDPVAGVSHAPAPAGTPCLDSNACNGAEQCSGSGVCVPGTPPSVDDENPCTADACHPTNGVTHTPIADGTPCGDDDVCNGAETCEEGECESGVALSPDDLNPCTFDTCDPETGISNDPLPLGTPCSDGDPCNGDEVCAESATCFAIPPEPLPDDCGEPPVSEYCGDGIRDTVSEECDDGPGVTLDACSEDCRVSDLPVAPIQRIEGERLARTLGYGRHPLVSGARGSLVAFSELEGSEHRLLGALYGARGNPSGIVDLGAGAVPSEFADASLAAVSPDLFVAAWNELGTGSLDVGLRLVQAGSPPVLGDVLLANTTLAGAQQDPDVLWTGAELVVAWSSDLTIVARRFAADLEPLSDEQVLGFPDELAGSVALARFGAGWAAAFRVIGDDGELIRVTSAGTEWSVGPFLPGAPLERPALVELDSERLLLVFSEGTDPLASGTPAVSRLRAAVLSRSVPGSTASLPIESFVDPYDGDETIAQSRPTLARVGTRLFLGWETEQLLGDELASEVWLQELSFGGGALVHAVERPIPLTVEREGPQRAPSFTASPLAPGGALALLFEHEVEPWPYAARPDLVFSLRPVPFVTLAGGGD